ncbi:hypothetical protein Csp2054_15400 [Curtobacterium sp. 'Ferrero']|nr:hypothetical protein Csp2054_15400 [Curtobacterium sp. 'Ferrero']
MINQWSPSLGVTEWGAMDATGRRVTYSSAALARANAPFWTVYRWDGNDDKLTINLTSDLSKCLGVFGVDTSHATIVRSGSVCNVAPQATATGSVWRIESGNLRWVPFSTPGFLTGRPSANISDTGGRFDVDRDNTRFSSLPTSLLTPTRDHPFTASGSFPADPARTAVYSGTAEPSTPIEVKDNGGKLVASTTSDADGNWTINFPAPDIRGSLYTVHVNQIIDGTATGNIQVDLDYGTRVSITTPTDQATVPAGATTISGAGEPGSQVQVINNGGTTPVLSTTVAANGTWTGSANLARGEHVLEAKQLSKGARTTTDTVTVNPGQSALTAATITTDEYTPGQRTTFTGTATAGATIDILAADDAVIASGVQVAADGSFSFQATPAASTTEYSFRVRQTLGSDTRTDGPFTIVGAVPVTVTQPTTVTPGVTNTFVGTGPAGSSYRVLNVSGTQIVPGTFTIDAQGNWTFQRVVSTGATKFDFRLETTDARGTTTTSPLFSIPSGQLTPVTVQTTQVIPGRENTFSGTATPGAMFSVLNISDTVLDPGIGSTFRVGPDGRWQFTRVVSTGATGFRFKVRQTLNGQTVTSELFTIPAATA